MLIQREPSLLELQLEGKKALVFLEIATANPHPPSQTSFHESSVRVEAGSATSTGESNSEPYGEAPGR